MAPTEMNREQRRALKKAKPQKGRGHIELPVNFRFAAAHETQLIQIPFECSERFKSGTADDSDWNTLMFRINWARKIDEAQFGQGADAIEKAQSAMIDVQKRGLEHGTWSTSTPEHAAICVALDLANQMQKLCTRRELAESLKQVMGVNEYNARVEKIKQRLDTQA